LFKRKIYTLGLALVVFLSSLFLSGCSEKPFLAEDGVYVILYSSPSGMVRSELVELPWNTNMAIMQKLLLESSFVLSDLHTTSDIHASSDIHTSSPLKPSINIPHRKTILKTTFAEPKRMSFFVDKQPLTLDVQSLQIEIVGTDVGQVTINQTITLQGIYNSNLLPAFEDFENMLHYSK